MRAETTALILFWFFDSDLKTAQSKLFSYPYQHCLNLFQKNKQRTVSCKEFITLVELNDIKEDKMKVS